MENDISMELIMKAREGDMVAFEKIYRLAGGFVYNVALRIVRRPAEAQDVAQEVFVKLYRNLSQFAFRSSLNTWLYRITVNTAISKCRREAREAAGFARYRNEIAADAAADPYPAPTNDNEARVIALLAGLDPEQRACVVLREMEGLSYQEISETMNITINTVRSRLHRARETLMELARREKKT